MTNGNDGFEGTVMTGLEERNDGFGGTLKII